MDETTIDNDILESISVVSATYNEALEALTLSCYAEEMLLFKTYEEIVTYFNRRFSVSTTLNVEYDDPMIDSNELSKYYDYFARNSQNKAFLDGLLKVESSVVSLMFSNDELMKEALVDKMSLLTYLNAIGCGIESVVFHVLDGEFEESNVVVEKIVVEKPMTLKQANRSFKRADIDLKDVEMEMENVSFEATIFDIETKMTKTDRMFQLISVHDDGGALTLKRFEGRSLSKEKMSELCVGDRVLVVGDIVYDTYDRELVCSRIKSIEKTAKKVVVDDASTKRIELHSHSNMSEMDAVCSVEQLIDVAFEWGHSGLAITDHMSVQSFPKAYNHVKKLLKKAPERDFKMVYGVEMNMVDEHLKIVRNPQDILIDDAEYIVFDLETTGLSAYYDHIIEFGGVLVRHGSIVERKQYFIKPPVAIPSFIQEKTGITDAMVADAPSFSDVVDDLLEWMANRVLVAHNAVFDSSFFNEELRKLAKPALTNTIVDTLDFARVLHSDRRTYRLGNIARLYKISYDEDIAHRADYDADVLANIFMIMIQHAKNRGAQTVYDFQRLENEQSFAKVRSQHVCVLAKNQKGLKDLYKLVTISNTDNLAVFKSSGEESLAEPRIFRENIQKYREHLLLGSACINGEVFEMACNRSQEDLRKAIDFYDYIEVQPLENMRHLIENNVIPSVERLQKVVRRIIDTAYELKKIVVATGDVHYAYSDQKILRDIYIQAQGVGGVRHPLYRYNAEQRRFLKNPNQGFLTTDQMLREFSWLNDDKLVQEIVVSAPNALCKTIDHVQPVPSGLYPPSIDGCDDKLRDICYSTAKRVYGDVLPSIVEERLERELKSIIGNGYAVIYYISHLLVKKSNDDGYLVGSRGSVGSSFVATMSGITEVNPLAPHYICRHCQYSDFNIDASISSGFDLEDKLCPNCQTPLKGEGQNIPFETFLGFEGDKVPDIDLNFSGQYQEVAHNFTKEVFGEDYVYRAGTIGTVANKTAFGYVSGYIEEMGLDSMRSVMKKWLAMGCEGVKRTSGQHPGGIIVIPSDMDVTDFTPVQFPANDPKSSWKTTHFDFHDIHDNVLKLDILGHVDPTAMRLLHTISGIDPLTIPMNDEKVMSLFSSSEALCANQKEYQEPTGALGLPEFGTVFVRKMLEATKPRNFSDLVIISGLSHGTDVWVNNASDLVDSGILLQDVIGCRDDIMTYLQSKGLSDKVAFTIMESVRKGKGLKAEWIDDMKEHDVPDWYIDSCLKIKYMFPKAHAVAYVIMAVRIAWFKVYHPHYYYISYFSLRCNAYEIETMCLGMAAVVRRMSALELKKRDKSASSKEIALYDTLEVCKEMYARGYRMSNVDLYKSLATEFSVDSDDSKCIIPPFTTIDGLGDGVAMSIVSARNDGEFLSKEDIIARTQVSSSMIKKFEQMKIINGLQERNQMSLFD